MKVIGIGDNVVDEYIHRNMIYPGGNAFNFTAYSRMLGVDSSYLGVFGTDDAGKYVMEVANKLEINIERSRVYEGENGHAYIDLKDGDRVFLRSNKGGISREKPIILNEDDLNYIKKFDLAVSSINSHIIDELPKIKAIKIPLAFDFSIIKKPEVLEKVCPYIDFAISSCGDMTDDELTANIEMFHRYGAKYVLATRGSKGAVFSDSNKKYSSEAKLIKATDTMGAGDAFLTRFLINFISLTNNNESTLSIEDIILSSLEKASEFSAKICMIDGAFGYGKSLSI